jgi:hypothetical protein
VLLKKYSTKFKFSQRWRDVTACSLVDLCQHCTPLPWIRRNQISSILNHLVPMHLHTLFKQLIYSFWINLTPLNKQWVLRGVEGGGLELGLISVQYPGFYVKRLRKTTINSTIASIRARPNTKLERFPLGRYVEFYFIIFVPDIGLCSMLWML